jgi:hypothetical protein
MRLGEAALNATFLPGGNIGLLTGAPSGGLVDVDCDTIEAQIAATTLLPQTPMAHGRTSGSENGRFTHYWYQIEGSLPRAEKFAWREAIADGRPDAQDVRGDVTDEAAPAAHTTSIVELRADGCQTMVPPSLHPDGGWLRWAA